MRSLGLSLILVLLVLNPVLAEEKVFSAQVTDSQGNEITLKNIRLYWEEQIGEATFIPHEVKYVPVRRGNATINVRFEVIKTIEVVGRLKDSPLLRITLKNGKTGEFPLAVPAEFIGESEFGEVHLAVEGAKRVLFERRKEAR